MNPERYAPIGVFDSGLGGLTVVREIMRNLPEERLVYFGDTARVPYGNKSKETVIRYSRQIVTFLKKQKVKAIVVACNTASALALDTIRPEIDLPIIGVVRPGTDMALKATRNKRIGVIATDSTIQSNLYQTLLREHDKDVQVFARACPLFVPLVEEGWTKDPVTRMVAERYLEEILAQNIDTLIMGCTHYPLLRKLLREVAGEDVELINPAYETAIALRGMLDENGLLNDGQHKITPQYAFYASDSADKFNEFANSILPYEIRSTTQVRVDEY
ncbi:MAG: glutamate racemase [Eubacterium sp.]|nr:glutamate racemase [Eubacterium sp.]